MDLDSRLQALAERRPDLLDDGPAFPRGDSAVLVLLCLHAEPGVLLTRRSSALRTDPGHVAFPGGRIEPGEKVEVAALRECEEETGVPAASVTVHGRLDATWNGAGYRLLPVVASTLEPITIRPRTDEVAEAAVLDLAMIADPDRHDVVTVTTDDGFEFHDDVIVHDQGWRLYGPTADIACDLVAWLEGRDRRNGALRRLELDHFARTRWP